MNRIAKVVFLVIGWIGLNCTVLAAQKCKVGTIQASTPSKNFVLDDANGLVIDRHTNLMWKRCAEGEGWNSTTLSCSGLANVFTWQEALNQASAINQLKDSNGNIIGFAGFTDWRVPNVQELMSLIEVQCIDPAYNLVLFPGVPLSAISGTQILSFWSSTSLDGDPNSAWIVRFAGGRNDVKPKLSSSLALRLVRDGG